MAVIGVDVGGTNIRVGLIEGRTLARVEQIAVRKTSIASEIVDDIAALIGRAMTPAVEGIGIGVPSVVDVERGIIYDVVNIPSWKEVRIKAALEEKFSLPVCVNNDANCFVVGEQYFGKGRGCDDIVGLIIGTGMGAGLVVQGKLYSGRNCGAGEFGMIPFRDNNYEYYCSGQFFEHCCNTTGEEMYERAMRNDAEALEAFSRFGTNLGEAIKLIMFAIDPEIIILGGSVSKAFPFYKKEMHASIASFLYTNSIGNLTIDVSDVPNVAVLGAGALYYDMLKS